VDGASVLLKREVRAEKIKPQEMKLQIAHEMVEYLRSWSNRRHASYSKIRWHIITSCMKFV
jgi:hypothetical protein